MTGQADFAAALLDPARAVPAGITSRTVPRPAKRFAVYRNNVVVGLIEALAARFPAVRAIVGEEFFAAMAGVYVRAEPPRSPLMMTYGDTLPDFLERFEPVAELAYLADVARLEAARTRAYHAADAEPLDPVAFATLDPAALDGVRVALRPGTTVLRSRHPIVTLWAMNAGEVPLAAIDDWGGENALVARDGFSVAVRRLPPGGGAFLAALAAGVTLAEAAAAGAGDDPAFDLTENLAGLIGAGLVIDVQTAETAA